MNEIVKRVEDMTPAERDTYLLGLEQDDSEGLGEGYPYLNFKNNAYIAGSDKVEINAGSVAVFDFNTYNVGWKKWWDNHPIEEISCNKIGGFKSPERSTLKPGPDEKDQWETHKDPWQRCADIMVHFAEGQSTLDTNQMCFNGSSWGFRSATGDLWKVFLSHYRLYPTEHPVIKLSKGTFPATDENGDPIDVPKPVLELIGWASSDQWAQGNDYHKKGEPRQPLQHQPPRHQPIAPARDIYDDDIPF